MTATTLTDRYIFAAMRTVPERQRADLSQELRGSVDDQIEARVAEGEDPAVAERAVLTELGDPDQLAAGFTGRQLHLLGPRYYLTWWRLLKLLLWIVIPSVVFAVSLGMVLAGMTFGAIIGPVIGIAITVTVHLFFWTTLVFVMIERFGTMGQPDPVVEWTLDSLPEPTENGVPLSELISSLAWLAIAAGAIIWDHVRGFVPGTTLPFLDPELWPWWVAGLFVAIALSATLSIVVYLRRRWTYALAVCNTLLTLAVTIPALWLLGQGRLVNPAFWDEVLDDAGADVPGILAVIVAFVIVGIAAWSVIDCFLKARRADR